MKKKGRPRVTSLGVVKIRKLQGENDTRNSQRNENGGTSTLENIKTTTNGGVRYWISRQNGVHQALGGKKVVGHPVD